MSKPKSVLGSYAFLGTVFKKTSVERKDCSPSFKHAVAGGAADVGGGRNFVLFFSA